MDSMLANNKEPVDKQRVTLDQEPEVLPDKVKKPSTKQTKKINQFKDIKNSLVKLIKEHKKIILIVVGVIVVAVAALLIVMFVTAPVHLTKVETQRAISSRTENPPVQSEFAGNDPVMLYFEYGGANVGTAVNYEVKNSDGEVVKSGATTILRETGDDKADGKRYISIVNTASTALPTGGYRIILTADGREVGAINFEISE